MPAADGFVSEVAAFVAMVRAPGGHAERAARAHSLDDAAALDALRESARLRRAVDVAPRDRSFEVAGLDLQQRSA